MKSRWPVVAAVFLPILGCVTEAPYDPLDDYVERNAVTLLDAPTVSASSVAPEDRDAVAQGEYLVELLGCGSCHTDGALVGVADVNRPLAGSRIGIAYTNPLRQKRPGIVYPPNITPDPDTGVGSWTDDQLTEAIRSGKNRHGGQSGLVMPWRGYALLSDSDAKALVRYLRSIEPVSHRVPDNVVPGARATERFVHFGVYESQ